MHAWRPPRYALIAAAAALGVLIGLVAALLRSSHAPAAPPESMRAQVTWAPGTKRAPLFALRDQRGQVVSTASLRGGPVLVTFLDSRCRSACPVEGRVLSTVLDELKGTNTVLLVVSVNPWSDTPASARDFAAHARWHGDWHWLLGSKATLAPVWRGFGIAVKRVPGDVVHEVALYVVDRHGDLRAAYLFPFSADAVISGARSVAG